MEKMKLSQLVAASCAAVFGLTVFISEASAQQRQRTVVAQPKPKVTIPARSVTTYKPAVQPSRPVAIPSRPVTSPVATNRLQPAVNPRPTVGSVSGGSGNLISPGNRSGNIVAGGAGNIVAGGAGNVRGR